MPTITYRDALNQALREEMQRDPTSSSWARKSGVYQGAYKVSRGLLEEFGAQRVVDTPIAELGFAGIGVGRRDGGPAAGDRVHDLELRAAGARPDRELRRQDALHVGRPDPDADRVPRARTARRCSSPRSTRRPGSRGSRTSPGSRSSPPPRPPTPRDCSSPRSATTTPSSCSKARCSTTPRARCRTASTLVPIGKADVKRDGHRRHHRSATRRRWSRRSRPPSSSRRARRVAPRWSTCARCARSTSRDPRLGHEDPPRRGRRGRLAPLRHRRAGGGRDPARGVRRARRAGAARHAGRRPDAVQQAARARWPSRRPRRSSPPPAACSTSTDMATKVFMEALSPTMEEGRLVKWKSTRASR